jgi:hypothetical protein
MADKENRRPQQEKEDGFLFHQSGENKRREAVSGIPLVFPSRLYPAFAPLAVPIANHLLLLQQRQYRRRTSRRPAPEEMMQAVLEKVAWARNLVYDYLRPFVMADKKRQQRGESRIFPRAAWLLETLVQYTPGLVRNSVETLDFWQKRALLRREKTRGLLEITSVAALLIARLAEEKLQRNWLPSSLEADEPHWWCYGRAAPDAPLQAIPVPIPTSSPPSLLVWTPWQGALWEDEQWQIIVGGDGLYRWANSPSATAMLPWDEELPTKILAVQDDPLFGRPSVQEVLLQEVRYDVLTRVVKKGMCS